ncbi:MAG: S41 family peptidase [Deltaproteobacteria bacterium]|nr:MAG: S41 family peptidase [Deltaproteobacteria bacterium]
MFKRKVAIALLLSAAVSFGATVAWLQSPRPAHAEATYSELQLFTDVLSIVRRSYVEEVPIKDLIYGAIDGMLASLDPHSGFMPPEVYKEMKIDTRGEFGGLGIEITLKDDMLTIVAPIEDTPAFRAGLAAGDRILKIGEQFTKGMEIMEAVRLMRGAPGTEVTIAVMREGFERPKSYTLKREVIKIKSVKAKTLEDGFGYARITQFQERTASDLERALEGLRKENGGKLKGVVLDLRNNPGGLLEQAVEVADLFLENGLIVYTKGRDADAQMEFSAKSSGTEPGYPVVVLINGGSASASEIVAGALQDHGRAVILGTQSFGKGSVQTILPLGDDSGLRLTTARYYTPKGTSIQAKGIVPDIEVQPAEVKEAGDRDAFREKDLPNHFDSEQPKPARPEEKKDSHFQVEGEQRSDYQLMRALDLLKGWQIFQGLGRPAA